jgi:predicted glycosyl hydrolase (DUF1957 family)
MYATMRRGSSVPGEIDPTRIGLARVLAYLLAWSFVGPDGQPADITETNIALLNVDMFRRLADALDAHERHVERLQDAEKNDPSGAVASAAISLSVA